jgi:magnesium transporter
MIKKRIGVLMGMLAASTLTALALGGFEEQIAVAPFLAMFITMVVSSGGNSGTQATTLVVRAMALGEVRAADWWLIMRREVLTGLALGSMLAVCVMLGVATWAFASGKDHALTVAIVVGLSVQGCVIFGTLTGSMLPFVLRRFGIDPASASAPAVTTIVDVTGILIYFAIANMLLRELLNAPAHL